MQTKFETIYFFLIALVIAFSLGKLVNIADEIQAEYQETYTNTGVNS